MSAFRYLPVKQQLSSQEAGHYVSFGLRALRAGPSGWVEAALIPDVSCDERFVTRLARQCTDCQLDPIHLLDVVLNALP